MDPSGRKRRSSPHVHAQVRPGYGPVIESRFSLARRSVSRDSTLARRSAIGGPPVGAVGASQNRGTSPAKARARGRSPSLRARRIGPSGSRPVPPRPTSVSATRMRVEGGTSGIMCSVASRSLRTTARSRSSAASSAAYECCHHSFSLSALPQPRIPSSVSSHTARVQAVSVAFDTPNRRYSSYRSGYSRDMKKCEQPIARK